MNIWILFCFFAVVIAENSEDESKNFNDLNKENEFTHRPIFPFDAFGAGYETLFEKDYAPLLAAMERYFGQRKFEGYEPEVTEADRSKNSEKSSYRSEQIEKSGSGSTSHEKAIESESSVSQLSEQKERLVSSESQTGFDKEGSQIASKSEVASASSSNTEKVLSTSSTSESGKGSGKSASLEVSVVATESESDTQESSQLSGISQSRSTEENSEKETGAFISESKSEVEQEASESYHISSGEVVFVLSPPEERDSEIEIFAESLETEEMSKGKAFSVSSEEKVIYSTSKGQRSGDSFSESKNVWESDSEPFVVSHRGIKVSSSLSEGEVIVSREMESAKSLSSDDGGPVVVSSHKGSSFWKVNNQETLNYQVSEANKGSSGLGHHLTIPAVRKHLEDSYSKLALLKKRLFRKDNVLGDLNEVIGELQLLCDVICRIVPVTYLMDGANIE